MQIGELARRSGLSVDTLRFYEKIGLIRPPARDAGGRRDYGADVLTWVAFLAQLNATGMKQVDRIRYADLRHKGASTVSARRQMLEDHRAALIGRIADLQRSLLLMDQKITDYRNQEARLGQKEAEDDGRT
ncbi:MAG TPA: MerR family transcriptional regulator [Paracoccaceae bacterium]|nr:MerR family transcriptional regulator [Paracoccaceae bacterium]